MNDLDCTRALTPLISALDLLNHTEIRNADDIDRCIGSEYIHVHVFATGHILDVVKEHIVTTSTCLYQLFTFTYCIYLYKLQCNPCVHRQGSVLCQYSEINSTCIFSYCVHALYIHV